jgi:hypothetical protein
MSNVRAKAPRKAFKSWLPFEEARVWARSQGLASEKEWRELRKAGLPENIPTNPNRTYAEWWKGWGDFLGQGQSKYRSRTYRSFEEARDWAVSQGIKSLREWLLACTEDRIPFDIPRSPWRAYEKWVSAPHFFSQPERKAKNRAWRSYEEAAQWVKRRGLASREDWGAALRAGEVPPDIPTNPQAVYAESGWRGFPAFLGRHGRGGSSVTEDVIAHELSHFTKVDLNIRSLPLPDGSRKRVDIVLPTQKIVVEYDGAHWHRKSIEKDMVTNKSLAETGWTVVRIRELPLGQLTSLDVLVDPGWPLIRKTATLLRSLQMAEKLPGVSIDAIDDYERLGRLFAASTGLGQIVGWRSFAAAKEWAKEQGVDSESKWRALRRTGGLPRDIPSNPDLVYAVNWVNWGDFFGTGRQAVRSADLVSYEAAKAWAQKSGLRQAREWTEANKAGLLPAGIPGTPSNVYADQWEGWGIFLGVSDSAKRRRKWKTFDEARQWARELALEHGVDSEQLWRAYLKTTHLPTDIPRAPACVYRDHWISWGDFFGTGNVTGGAARWRKARSNLKQ